MNTFIYTLADPRTGYIRYVGKANDIATRFLGHLKKENTKKRAWIQTLLAVGVRPKIEILDEVPESEWSFWEQHWIQVVRGWGFDLTNGDNGGLGNGRLSPSVRLKISKSLVGMKYPSRQKPVYKYSMDGSFIEAFESLSLASRIVNGTTSNLLRAIRTFGVAHGFRWSYNKTATVDRHIREYTMTHEHRETLRRISTGRIVSKETRQKMRLAKLGKVRTPDGVANCAERNKALIDLIEKVEDMGDEVWLEVS